MRNRSILTSALLAIGLLVAPATSESSNALEIKVAPEILEIPSIDEVATPIITKEHTYYIIAGAFAEQNNANKMLAKLSRWNYNAEIVPGGSLLRVSYESYNNREEAVLALNKIQQANASAWLLTK